MLTNFAHNGNLCLIKEKANLEEVDKMFGKKTELRGEGQLSITCKVLLKRD